jgi:hypothetical protein
MGFTVNYKLITRDDLKAGKYSEWTHRAYSDNYMDIEEHPNDPYWEPVLIVAQLK